MAKRWKQRWQKPTRRDRLDRYLESQGLLNYQTKGMSADQIAAKYKQAGVNVRDSWFKQNYGGGSSSSNNVNPSQTNPTRQFSGRGTGNSAQNFPQDRIVQSQTNFSSGYNNPDTTTPNNKVIKDQNVVVTKPPKSDPYGYGAAEAVLTDHLNLAPDHFSNPVSQKQAEVGINGIATVDDVVKGNANWSDIAVDQRKQMLSDPTFYKENKITAYSPAVQQQILADTNFDWNQLPKWQEIYWKTMSNPKVMASPMALAGAQVGKPFGLVGTLAGAAGGYALGLVGGQEYDPTKGVTEQPSLAASAMRVLNVLSENVEQGVGYSGQLLDAAIAGIKGDEKAAKAAHDMLFDPATRSGAWEAGRLTYEYSDTGGRHLFNLFQALSGEAPLALFSDNPHIAQAGQDFVIGASMPVDKESAATGRIDPFTGKPAYVTDVMQVLMDARHEIRDEINKGGDPDAVTKKYLEQANIYVGSQIQDLAWQSKFDPLNEIPSVNSKLQVKGLEAVNERIRANTSMPTEQANARIKINEIKAQVYRDTPNTTGMLFPQGEAARKFRALVQAAPNLKEEAKYMTRWERTIAGITPDGKIKELLATEQTKVPKKIMDLVTLQPKAKAKLFLRGYVNTVKLLADWTRGREIEPRQLYDILSATGNGDSKTLRDMGAEFMSSPEAYTVIGATKDFLPTVLQHVTDYETTGANREMFWKLQGILGDEPKRFLKDFVDGNPVPTFERLKAKLALLETPEAKQLLQDITDGNITPETLTNMFGVFKDGKTPINNQEFLADALGAFDDHMKDWGKEYFDLKNETEWEATFRLLKGAQSLLLLDLSPQAIINDFVNERVMMAMSGTLGLTSRKEIDAFFTDFGLQIKEGGAGLVGDVAKAESGVIEDITRGKGKIAKVASGINKVRSKLPRSILSSKFNKAHAEQIGYAQAKAFWSRTWTEGKGFKKMDVALETRLKELGIDPKTIYQNIRSSFRLEDIENFKERAIDHNIHAYIDEAAGALGKPAQEISAMLDSLGVLDTLKEQLAKADTPVERQQVFDSIRETVRRQSIQRDAQHLTGMLDHFKNKVGLEKQAGALHAAQDIALDFFEGRMENDKIWDEAWARVARINDKKLRNQILSKAAEDAASMWELRQLRHEALYAALFDSVNASPEFYFDFIKLLRNEHMSMRQFFSDKSKAVQDLINLSADYETKNALWEAHNKEFNERFNRDHKGVIESQKLRNDLFVAEQGRLFGAEGEAMARAWVDSVMEHTEMIHNEIVAFREFLADDGNMPSQFVDKFAWHDAAWREFKPKVYQRMWAERLQADMKGAAELYKWDESPETVQKYVDAKRLTQQPPIGDELGYDPMYQDAIESQIAAGMIEVLTARLDQVSRKGSLSEQLAEVDSIYSELTALGLEIQPRAGKKLTGFTANLLRQLERERELLLNQIEHENIKLHLEEFEGEHYPEGLETLKEQLNNAEQPEGEMPIYPPSGYDQTSGWMDIGRMIEDGYIEHVVPVLDAMKKSSVSNQKHSTFEGIELDSRTQSDLDAYLRDVRSSQTSAKRAAKGWAEAVIDYSLLDYERQYGFDKLVSMGFPYEFFATRTGMNTMVRVLDRPAWVSHYARLQRMHDTYENNLPERMRNKYFIPVPFLPEWAGGGVFIDPTFQLYPFKSFIQPLEAIRRDKVQLNNSAGYILREWEEDGTYTTEQVVEALTSMEGNLWERAVAEAEFRQGDNANTGADYFSMLFGPALYATVPYYLATGKKMTNMGYPSGQLPITKFGQAVETVFKGTPLEWVGNAAGLLAKPEKIAREKMGLNEFGEWGDFYIDRQLANMAAEGTDPKLIQMAMIERKGELYDQAEQRVRQELMLKVPMMLPLYGAVRGERLDQIIGSALPALFPSGLLPEAEMEQKGLKQEFSQVWNEYARTGDRKSTINKFFEEHPEYEVRLALRKDPKERLNQFLKSEIWDAYGSLGTTDRKTVSAFLGDDFSDYFLSGDPSVEFSTEQLAMWSKVMRGLVPAVPETQTIIEKEQQGQIPQINYYDESVTRITDQFFAQRTKEFPNYYVQQQEYFALPKSRRSAYLLANPELKSYWEWKRKWDEAYPAYKPVFDNKVFKRVDTSTWSPMLEDFVADYAYTGNPLPNGAMKALEQQWILEGRPYDSLQVWLDSQVAPAMLYGGQ